MSARPPSNAIIAAPKPLRSCAIISMCGWRRLSMFLRRDEPFAPAAAVSGSCLVGYLGRLSRVPCPARPAADLLEARARCAPADPTRLAQRFIRVMYGRAQARLASAGSGHGVRSGSYPIWHPALLGVITCLHDCTRRRVDRWCSRHRRSQPQPLRFCWPRPFVAQVQDRPRVRGSFGHMRYL